MIASVRELPRHRRVYAFAVMVIGALGALLALEAVAAVANLLGLTALHDVGVNTGPLAAVGGGGAGLSAWADPYIPGTTTIVDPDTGQSRDPSLYDQLVWEFGRRMMGLPTPQESHDRAWSDYYDRVRQSYTETIPEAPPAEPTTPYGDPLAEPPDQAGGFGSVGHPAPPGSGQAAPDPGPPPGAGELSSGGQGFGATGPPTG